MYLTEYTPFQKGDEELPLMHLSAHHPVRGRQLWETSEAYLVTGSSNNFHHHFRSRAFLKFMRLVIPNPPNSFLLQTLLQFTRQMPFPSVRDLISKESSPNRINFLFNPSREVVEGKEKSVDGRKYLKL